MGLLRAGYRLLPALAFASFAADASAFCRTRTCQLRDDVPCPRDPVSGCYTEGSPVYWGSDCLSYAVQRDGSIEQGISAEQVATLLDEGFRAWSDGACANGETPAITAQSQGLIACGATEFNCQDPEQNSNIVAFRDSFEDTIAFRFGVIALTTLTANTKTGQIFDADIEINSRDEDFVIGEPPADSTARDLRGVINHELGHLLGLSHPNERTALMYSDYRGTVLPAADDIAGICDIRGGSRADPQCEVVELPADAGCVGQDVSCKIEPAPGDGDDGSGCECALPARREEPHAAWAGVLLLACWLWRRR